MIDTKEESVSYSTLQKLYQDILDFKDPEE